MTAQSPAYQIDEGVARLLQLGLKDDIESRLQEWHEHLSAGSLTEEMRQVFVAFGWLTPRDRRVSKIK